MGRRGWLLVGLEERDARLAAGLGLMGDKGAQERWMTVPAGSVVIKRECAATVVVFPCSSW